MHDEELSVPDREVRAALALADGLLVALTARDGLADKVAGALPPLSCAARLPEVAQALRARCTRCGTRHHSIAGR